MKSGKFVRRGSAEHSTGPLSCGFALVPVWWASGALSASETGRLAGDPPDVPAARLERATFCSGGKRSIQLSYAGWRPDHTELTADDTVRWRSGSLGSVIRDDDNGPLRRAPQLAVLLEGEDRKGLLHDMTAAILRHGGDIVLVEIIERGARSVVYWELDGVDDPDGLARSFLEIDVVQSLQRLPTMYQVWGKRIIVVGAGAQVGQVAIGAIGEADRHNIRGEKISVDTIPIVGEANLANAVRAVARLPRAVAVVLAGSLMGGEVTRAVDEVRGRGILVVSLNMAGSVPEHADLVVTDPVQAGVMAVRAVASTASFDIGRVRGQQF